MTTVRSRPRPARALGRALALALAAAAPGCGHDPDAAPAVPAAGTITYKGQPIKAGSITFLPEKGRPAQGVIEDGKFTMSTYGDGDGAVAGKHKVGVVATEEAKKTKDYDTSAKFVIPAILGSPEESGLTVEVPPGGSRNIKFEVR